MTNNSNFYKTDLAYIHDLGFRDYALNAAPEIISILRDGNIRDGLIVDLGCGSGLLAKELVKVNYEVLGIDISPAMIALAKEKVPRAEFKIDSLLKTEIPTCKAVVSVGECLNYLCDSDNNEQTLKELFKRIYRALLPGGTLIFDILKPIKTEVTKGFKEGKDWLILFQKEEDRERKTLTRRITTFRQIGDYYRRDDEVHQVCLYEPEIIKDILGRIGYRVQTQLSYGNFQLSKGHRVFVAFKNC